MAVSQEEAVKTDPGLLEVKEEPKLTANDYGDTASIHTSDLCYEMDFDELKTPILDEFSEPNSISDIKPAIYEENEEVESLSLPVPILQSMFDSALCGSCSKHAVKVKYEVSEMCPHNFIVYCGACGEILFH